MLSTVSLGCVQRVVPPPDKAISQWVQAVESDDATLAHSLLSRGGQRTHNIEAITELFKRYRPELVGEAKGSSDDDRRILVSARVVGRSGWIAQLDLEGTSSFRITSAVPLPLAAQRPEDALGQLRLALEHRSHPGLLRILTTTSGRKLENELKSLIIALEDPEATSVIVRGRKATVTLSGGHTITLEREDGFWKVKDFN